MAARTAVAHLTDAVRSHEQNAKIGSAIDHLRSADDQFRSANIEAATAYLFVSWTALLDARELTIDVADRQLIAEYVVSVRRAYDDLRSPRDEVMSPEQSSKNWHVKITRTLDGLGNMAAKSRISLLGIGAKK